MNNSNNDGCLAILSLLGQIFVYIKSGILAWDWIEPSSFGGVLAFLFVWGILAMIGHYILVAIVLALSDR